MNINSGLKSASTFLIVFFAFTLLVNDSDISWKENLEITFSSYKTIIGIFLGIAYGVYKAKKDSKLN